MLIKTICLLVCIVSVYSHNKEEWLALEKSFVLAAQKIAPYVVQIEVKRTKDIPLPPPSFFLQDFEKLPRVDRRNWKKFLEKTIEVSRRPKGSVSGIIISKNGEIITSYYNVAGSITDITIHFNNKNYPAKIIAYSKLDDIALLKISQKTDATFIRSHDPKIGSWSIVVGRSKSLKYHTANMGIVSGKKRYKGYSSQTDAKINFGNSGGAVVDIHGNLVGVVNRVSHYAKSGQSSGVGFFTTTKRLRKILPFLRKRKNISIPQKAFLGVRVSQMRKRGDIYSIKIDSVFPNTPAHNAGLRNNDIVIGIQKTKIKSPDDFIMWIKRVGPGKKLHLKIIRNNRIKKISITLGKRPSFF